MQCTSTIIIISFIYFLCIFFSFIFLFCIFFRFIGDPWHRTRTRTDTQHTRRKTLFLFSHLRDIFCFNLRRSDRFQYFDFYLYFLCLVRWISGYFFLLFIITQNTQLQQQQRRWEIFLKRKAGPTFPHRWPSREKLN